MGFEENLVNRFAKWFGIKPQISSQITYPKFEEGQVWWCHLGENIGDEENGKGDKFLRPVIVIKKFNQRIFYGIPTSSKNKNNNYYFQLEIKGKQVSALLSQMRLFDAKRLYYKQSKLSNNDLNLLKKKFVKIVLK